MNTKDLILKELRKEFSYLRRRPNKTEFDHIEEFISSKLDMLEKDTLEKERETFLALFNTLHCRNCQKKALKILKLASTNSELETHGDGHYCTHHPDDPNHGEDCYKPPVDEESKEWVCCKMECNKPHCIHCTKGEKVR